MAKLYNLARMTTLTTGSGVITLAEAVSGHLTFAQVGVKDGDTISYAIVDGQALELGRGKYNISGPILTRDVLQSTNGNLPLILTGVAEVYISEMSGGGTNGGGGEGLIPLEGPGIDLIGLTIGVGLDSILVAHADGSPATEYQKNNLVGALAGTVSGDAVMLCPGIFEGGIIVPVGVAVVGIDRSKCVLTGSLQLSDESVLANLTVTRSGAGTVVGVEGPASGTAYIYNTTIIVTDGSPAIALHITGGNVEGNYNEFLSTATDGYGVKIEGLAGTEQTYNSWQLSTSPSVYNYGFVPPSTGTITTPEKPLQVQGGSGNCAELTHASGGGGKGWITYDLGEVYNIHNMEVYWQWGGWIQVVGSLDGTTWVDMKDIWPPERDTLWREEHSADDISQGAWHNPIDVSARYIRFYNEVFPLVGSNLKLGWFKLIATTTARGVGRFRWCKIFGTAMDIYVDTSSALMYACQFDPLKCIGQVSAMRGDRSAWDAEENPGLHANDIDIALGIHHTLGTEATQAASGDHQTHAVEDLTNVVESGEMTGDILQLTDWTEAVGGTESLYASSLLTTSGTGDSGSLWDGDKTAQWLSNSPGPHYELFAFPDKKYFISKVVVTANAGDWMWADHPTEVHLYGSNTGSFGGEETLIVSQTGLGEGIYTLVPSEPRVGYRYYKIVFIRADANCRVNEVEVYTLPDEPQWENRSLAGAGINVHDPVTVSDTTTVNLTLTGQALSAAVTPGGIKLDDLGAPDDNTDLNASTTKHGLMQKYPGGTTDFLRADGSFASPPGGSGGTRMALFKHEGALVVGSGVSRIYNLTGAGLTISKVHATLNSAPTGASAIFDVHKDGVTIFTTQSNRPTVVAGANTGETTTIDVATWANGSYLTADVDQIGSGVAGSDLTLTVVCA